MADLQAAQDASRRVAVAEARAVREATRMLDARLEDIAATVRAQAPLWRRDPAAAMRGRRALAAKLRAIRPGAAAAIRAGISDSSVLDDDLIRSSIRGVDAAVRAKARVTASLLTRGSLSTDRQVQDLVHRILAVATPAEEAASLAAVRAANLAIQGKTTTLVWVVRPGCCVHCAEMAGSVSRDGALFQRRLKVADRVLPWAEHGLDAPPAHPHCRCTLVEETRGLADAYAKNAARDVAEGKTGWMSAPARARAARRLLKSRASLNPTARRRAARLARTIT